MKIFVHLTAKSVVLKWKRKRGKHTSIIFGSVLCGGADANLCSEQFSIHFTEMTKKN